MNIDLTGKEAVVCGSTQGIGWAVASELAQLGAKITLLARNEKSLQQAVARLPNTAGQEHNYLVADFADPSTVSTAISQYMSTGGAPTILVNNTGGPTPGPIIEEEYTKFENTLSAHLHCNHILAQALVPIMKKDGYGRIINIISTSVYMPIPGLGVSNTTRGAVASWAKTLSIELGQHGITVNNVLPGLTDTARLQSLIDSKSTEGGVSREDVVKSLVSTIPANRFGEAQEVGAVAAFLATPVAAYVNGVSIPVDGGKTGCI